MPVARSTGFCALNCLYFHALHKDRPILSVTAPSRERAVGRVGTWFALFPAFAGNTRHIMRPKFYPLGEISMESNTPLYLTRSVAKWVLISIVDVKTTQITAETIADYTNYEKDDLIVKLGSGAVGMIVSARLKPVTDAAVDKTADFAVKQWEKRRTKKETQDNEK
jgi:hypothetical protein